MLMWTAEKNTTLPDVLYKRVFLHGIIILYSVNTILNVCEFQNPCLTSKD